MPMMMHQEGEEGLHIEEQNSVTAHKLGFEKWYFDSSSNLRLLSFLFIVVMIDSVENQFLLFFLLPVTSTGSSIQAP